MPQTATIKSLPAAFRMMKAMQAEDFEWGEDYRGAAQQALTELLEGRMDQLIDERLERMAELGQADRRNGCYRRHLLTELGDIELAVPRTRTFSALKVVRAYARRAHQVDRMILACFVLGLSTRKVATALLPVLGRPVSPLAGQVGGTGPQPLPDRPTRERRGQAARLPGRVRERGPNPTLTGQSVAAFHRRPLKDIYRVLVLDGVVLRRKTGAGALARPVLVALGLRPDGKKEVIDFRLASAESAAQWERFLGDLVRRGLTDEHLDMLCVDGLPTQSGVGAPLPNPTGQSGLLAALPTAFPDSPVQRCWAHKIRNLLNKVRTADQAAIKVDLHRIMNATILPAAWSATRRFADRWDSAYPKAVACLRADLDDLLTCFRYPTLEQRKTVRTTDEIDKRFVSAGAMISAHGRPRGKERDRGWEPRRGA